MNWVDRTGGLYGLKRREWWFFKESDTHFRRRILARIFELNEEAKQYYYDNPEKWFKEVFGTKLNKTRSQTTDL